MKSVWIIITEIFTSAILLGAAIWGILVLIDNTKPHDDANIKKLIETIKTNTKKTVPSQKVTETKKELTLGQYAYGKSPFPISTPYSKSVITEKNTDIPDSYVISQKDLDTALNAVALVAKREAADEYKNNLSVLLTILTIFGIAWPIIISILQSQKIKLETEKINEQYQRHEDIINRVTDFQRDTIFLEFADNSHANEWFWNFESEKYKKQVEEKEQEITGAESESKKHLENEKRKKEKSLYALMKNSAKSQMKTIYYNALAHKISRANSKVSALLGLLEQIQKLISEGKTTNARVVKEIDWGLFREKGVNNSQELEKKFRKIFCSPWEEDAGEEEG